MRLYGDIQRVDEEQRMVWGYASTEQRAMDGLVITTEAMRGAFDDYMAFANIREMHQPSAVGRAEPDETYVDDKGIYVGAKVIDDDAWLKVTERVYKGFSIGAKITERDPIDRTTVTGINIYEISLVDRPSDPGAVFDVWRSAGDHAPAASQQPADAGAEEENTDMSRAKPAKPAQAAETPADLAEAEAAVLERAEGDPDAEAVAAVDEAASESEPGAEAAAAEADMVEPTAAERAQAAVAGLEEAVERAATPTPDADAPSPIEAAIAEASDVQRGLYTVADLGQCLQSLAYIIFSAQYEAEAEGDNSPVPAKLKEGMKALADGFKAMATEEVNELLVDLGIARAAPAAASSDEEIARLQGDNEALTRTLGDVAEKVEGLTRRVAELAAQPAAPKAAVSHLARVVDKEADAGGQEVEATGPEPSTADIKRFLDAMSEEDRALYLTRAALARPVAIRTR